MKNEYKYNYKFSFFFLIFFIIILIIIGIIFSFYDKYKERTKYENLNICSTFYKKILIDVCEEFNISPYYLDVHIMGESSWDRTKKGKDDDIGLGQLIPTTAIEEAQRRGFTNLAKEIKKSKYILFDPYINIYLTAAHCRTILDMETTNDIIDFMGQYNKGKNHWKMKNNYPIRLKRNYENKYGQININKIFLEMK